LQRNIPKVKIRIVFSTSEELIGKIDNCRVGLNIGAIQINEIPTLLAIVKTGNWHTILTKISVAEQDLVTIPIEGKKMSRTAMAVSLSDAYSKRAMLAFSRMLKKENRA
jgi:LysR family cyn operon transcriptional activator